MKISNLWRWMMRDEELSKAREVHRANRNVELFYRTFAIITVFTIIMYWLEAVRHVPWLAWLNAQRWEVPIEIFRFYNALLFAYVTSKEITRWCKLKQTTRRGGRWVCNWSGSFLAICLLSIFFECVTIPQLLEEQAILVLGAFFGGETFKKLYVRRMKNDLVS